MTYLLPCHKAQIIHACEIHYSDNYYINVQVIISIMPIPLFPLFLPSPARIQLISAVFEHSMLCILHTSYTIAIIDAVHYMHTTAKRVHHRVKTPHQNILTKMESASTPKWNRCPHQSGIGVHTKVESVSTPKWNRCPHQNGISTPPECNVYTITKFKQYTIILTLISLHTQMPLLT